MGYLIFITDQISPPTVTRPGPQGGEIEVVNPEMPPLPENSTIFYQPAIYSRFSANPIERTLLLLVPEAGDPSPDNVPGFRDWQANQVRAACDKQLSVFYGYYLDFERTTWPQQRRECEMLASGVITGSTPTIDAIATARGVTRQEQYQRTLAAIQRYDSNCLSHLGVQQQILDRIYTATTVSAVLNEAWPTGAALIAALAATAAAV